MVSQIRSSRLDYRLGGEPRTNDFLDFPTRSLQKFALEVTEKSTLARDSCWWSASRPGHFNIREERLGGPVWIVSTRSQSLYPACNQTKIPWSSSLYPHHYIAYRLRVRCNILPAWHWRRITGFETMSAFNFLKRNFRVDRAPSWLSVIMVGSFSWLCWCADVLMCWCADVLMCWWAWEYGTIQEQRFVVEPYPCVSKE